MAKQKAGTSYREGGPKMAVTVHSSIDRPWPNVHVTKERFDASDAESRCYSEHLLVVNSGAQVHLDYDTGEGHLSAVLPTGGIVLAPAGKSVGWKLNQDTTGVAILLDSTWLMRYFLENTEKDPSIFELRPQVMLGHTHLTDIMRRFATLLQQDIPGTDCDTLMNQLASQLIECYATRPHRIPVYEHELTAPKLRRVLEYIEEHLATLPSKNEKPLLASAMASEVEIRQSHFERSFKKRMGVTPKEYVLWRRVNEAVRLLRSGKKLVDIAVEVAAHDQPALNKWFKNFLGFTPGEYKKMVEQDSPRL